MWFQMDNNIEHIRSCCFECGANGTRDLVTLPDGYVTIDEDMEVDVQARAELSRSNGVNSLDPFDTQGNAPDCLAVDPGCATIREFPERWANDAPRHSEDNDRNGEGSDMIDEGQPGTDNGKRHGS